MEFKRSSVVKIALISRLIIFVLQILFDLLLPDHEPTDVFNPPSFATKVGPADDVVEFALSGFRRWDSIYMIHIAEYGYVYEHTMAFFPIFPLSIRLVGLTLLYPLQYMMTARHVLMVSAFLLNTTCFVLAALYLYALADYLLENGKREAWICTILFCFNPASVFMSAAYTECMFALFTFALMYHLEKKEYTKATIALALATGTRSNGLVLVGYPLYQALKLLLPTAHRAPYLHIARDWLKLASCCMYGVVPFVIYQYMGYAVYCKGKKMDINSKLIAFGKKMDYHMPSDAPSAWCFSSIPMAYGYIQSFYWKNGLFAYYQWKQLPNFLLALPIVLLCVYTLYTYSVSCMKTLRQSGLRLWLANNSSNALPYMLHLLFMLLFGLANVHVQILTRMICSSTPLMYLCVAQEMTGAHSWPSTPFIGKITLIYSISYFILGTALHSNFFPWT